MTPTPRALSPAGRPTGWFPLPVSGLDRLAEDAVAVTLAVPEPLAGAFAHQAGQHVVVRHRQGGTEIRRSYSVCPPPFARDRLRLVVRRASPDGFGAYALGGLAVGDRLDVSPPAGSFRLEAAPGAHHVLVAGGTGIAPLLAMAAAALGDDPGCRVSLLYASRDAAGVLLAEELADLKDAHLGRLAVLHVLSRERREADLLSGRIDRDRLWRLLAPLGADVGGTTVFYLCGPWGLVEVAREALAQAGASPRQVRVELFSAEGVPPAPEPPPHRGGVRISARIGGRTSAAQMLPGDRVLLDALLRTRPDTPYSCRVGLCGSCRARVVDGAAAMGSQFALDAAEVAAGFTLACRARATTGRIGLDFDA
ncbi:ferredoxin--NADP reductase [Streptomyces cocklensis]|uniref:1,2-phenylacetyl-CoA epoxidase, subunit E n=1 Tax=Actinacidiphila cocklensis TaxID=887465 RepID=A0A9W4E3Y6_9ACTN|nr:ferredoxin--NADP reductase [Actinacidiphila cocklensis]MDD1062039.1 ferredoxin--NADP reductase [Actinacidiphila cocklensis]CAG6398705.1 putative 1,2-phenylacetyl-CoA epoxidase, subunit E [Actinacidiphila cocklensis]